MSTDGRAFKASRLLYKALQTGKSPKLDLEYRDLLATFRAEPDFQKLCSEIANGLELQILDVTERGIVIAPSNPNSRFAYGLSDIKTGMSDPEKCALVLAHVAIAAVFFPTTEALDNEEFVPAPQSIAKFRDALYQLAKHLESATITDEFALEHLRPGWDMIARSTMGIPGKSRASVASIEGIVKLAVNSLRQGGLLKDHLGSEDEVHKTYTPTFRFRTQLRDFALGNLYELVREKIGAQT